MNGTPIPKPDPMRDSPGHQDGGATLITLEPLYGPDVVRRLVGWHRGGLLRPFVLVDVDGRLHDDSPLRGLGAYEKSHEPESVLASRGVRLVNVLVTSSGVPTPEAVSSTLTRIKASLAEPEAGRWVTIYGVRSDDEARFQGLPLNPSVVHLVITDEDRIDDESMRLAEQDAPIAARLAFTTATVAGLFKSQGDVPASAIDTAEGPIHLVRTFGRLAIGPLDAVPDLRQRLTALQQDAREMALCVGGVPAADAAGICESAARRYVSGAPDGTLRYDPFQGDEPPRAQDISLLSALKMMWSEFVQYTRGGLTQLANEVTQRAISTLEAKAQRMIYGEGSMYRVRVAGSDHPLPQVSTELMATAFLSAQANQSINIPATPRVWQDLRAAAFSLVDGGDPPDYVQLPSLQNKRLIVAKPGLIAPDPLDEQAKAPPIDGLRACDPMGYRAIRQKLSMTPVPPNQIPAIETALANSSEPPQGSEAGLDTLDGWLARRKDSFSWHVAELTEEALRSAEEDVIAAQTNLAARLQPSEPPSLEDEQQLKKRRKRRLLQRLVLVLIVALILLAPAVGFAVGALAVGIWLALQLVCLIGVIAGLCLRYVHWLRARFQAKYRLTLSEWELNQEIQRAIYAADAYLRLKSAYSQLVEWSDVIAEMCHRPFGHATHPDFQPGSASEDFRLDGPLSLVTGFSTISADSRTRLALAAGRGIFGRRWLSELFATRSDEITTAEERRREVDASEAGLEADYDVSALFGYIAALCSALRAQGEANGDRLQQLIVDDLVARPIDAVFDVVQSPHSELPQTPDEFFRPCLPDAQGGGGRLGSSLVTVRLGETWDSTKVAKRFLFGPFLSTRTRDDSVGLGRGGSPFLLNNRLAAIGLRLDVSSSLPEEQLRHEDVSDLTETQEIEHEGAPEV
jgi:hypothetical protein